MEEEEEVFECGGDTSEDKIKHGGKERTTMQEKSPKVV
jgi:hypothetical protein